jgi:hypothetical protein
MRLCNLARGKIGNPGSCYSQEGVSINKTEFCVLRSEAKKGRDFHVFVNHSLGLDLHQAAGCPCWEISIHSVARIHSSSKLNLKAELYPNQHLILSHTRLWQQQTSSRAV